MNDRNDELRHELSKPKHDQSSYSLESKGRSSDKDSFDYKGDKSNSRDSDPHQTTYSSSPKQ